MHAVVTPCWELLLHAQDKKQLLSYLICSKPQQPIQTCHPCLSVAFNVPIVSLRIHRGATHRSFYKAGTHRSCTKKFLHTTFYTETVSSTQRQQKLNCLWQARRYGEVAPREFDAHSRTLGGSRREKKQNRLRFQNYAHAIPEAP